MQVSYYSEKALEHMYILFMTYERNTAAIKGAVSRNLAKLGNYKMPVKLRET